MRRRSDGAAMRRGKQMRGAPLTRHRQRWNGEDAMRSITRILAGAAVAAGVFGAGAAMAMGDAYTHGDRIYYYELPATTYYETYTYQPYAYETYTYHPYAYREYRYQP